MDFDRILIVSDFPTTGDNWTLYVKFDEDQVATAKYYQDGEWKDFKFAEEQTQIECPGCHQMITPGDPLHAEVPAADMRCHGACLSDGQKMYRCIYNEREHSFEKYGCSNETHGAYKCVWDDAEAERHEPLDPCPICGESHDGCEPCPGEG